MAISTVNAVLAGTAATKTGQTALFGPSDSQSYAYRGTFTATLDGSDTDFTVNWIDGTQVLPFTPSGVIATRNGGTGLASISVANVSTITSTSALVTLSAAGTNLDTVKIAFEILK